MLAGGGGAAWWLLGRADARRTARPPVVEQVEQGTAGPPLNVAVIGTSLSHRQPWTRDLARDLARCLNRPVRLRVAAMPGASSRWGVRWLSTVLTPPPDVALVEFATNDADWRRGLSGRASAANLAAMLARLRAARAATVVIAMPDPVGPRAPLFRAAIGRYQARHAATARAYGAAYLDLRARSADPGMMRPDGVHPHPAALSAALTPSLARRLCNVGR